MPSNKNMSPSTQRILVFKSLDEIVGDAERLLNQGYRSTGNWNLAQVCGHCGNWMSYPMDGFPRPFFLIGMVLWLMKVTIGKRQLRKILSSGKMASGQPTMPASVPTPDAASDQAAVAKLGETIAKFKKHDQPWHPSPLFGDMDTETLTQLQLIHVAHHFSFLLPADSEVSD